MLNEQAYPKSIQNILSYYHWVCADASWQAGANSALQRLRDYIFRGVHSFDYFSIQDHCQSVVSSVLKHVVDQRNTSKHDNHDYPTFHTRAGIASVSGATVHTHIVQWWAKLLLWIIAFVDTRSSVKQVVTCASFHYERVILVRTFIPQEHCITFLVTRLCLWSTGPAAATGTGDTLLSDFQGDRNHTG